MQALHTAAEEAGLPLANAPHAMMRIEYICSSAGVCIDAYAFTLFLLLCCAAPSALGHILCDTLSVVPLVYDTLTPAPIVTTTHHHHHHPQLPLTAITTTHHLHHPYNNLSPCLRPPLTRSGSRALQMLCASMPGCSQTQRTGASRTWSSCLETTCELLHDRHMTGT